MTPILQFGTSRFLQAHADLFLSEARAAGQICGPITVVQTTADAARARRLSTLADPAGFPIRIRGIANGQTIDAEQRVTSIHRALSTPDWPEVTRIAVEEAEILLSNTGDAGFAPQPADAGQAFDPAMSYPAKLLTLLAARHSAGARPLQIMPMELISSNGAVLKARVLELAAAHPMPFRDWLNEEVIWANSLVDRIVSEPLDPAGAVAEPYALWAIEDQPRLNLPCDHPAVQRVSDLATVEALKLFILNLGHTFIAHHWRGDQGPQLVRDWVADPKRHDQLVDLYRAEVLPAFAAAGQGPQAEAYLTTTMERFANPFLDHRIADIAQNHAQKIQRRIVAFLNFARAHGDGTPKPRLRATL